MKKFIAILLAAATITAASVPAFAENEEVAPAEQNTAQQVELVEEKEEKTEVETPAPAEERAEENEPVEEAPAEQPVEPVEQEEEIPVEQSETPEISAEEIKNFLASDEVKSALKEAGLDEDEIEDVTEEKNPNITYITEKEFEAMRRKAAFSVLGEAIYSLLEGVASAPLILLMPMALVCVWFPVWGPWVAVIAITPVGFLVVGTVELVGFPIIAAKRYRDFELPKNYEILK